MKTTILFILIILSAVSLKAQDQLYNLVNNYSFEDTLYCPTAQEQINYAKGWNDPLIDVPGFTGSDYYNECAIGLNSMNVPHASGQGFQYARTGVAFAGIWVYNYWSKEREYIETFLAETLKTNNIYFTEFFVSKSEPAIYAVNQIGGYLSDTLIHKNTDFYNFNLTPQINNPKNRFITDTIGWTKISGIYKAYGGEKYITIGNFMPDSLTDTVSVPNIPYGKAAYYFIDDVSVFDITADAGKDTVVCENGDSVMIGTHNLSFCKYQWSPTIGLNNPNIATPKAFPSITTTYILTVSFADTVFINTTIDTIYTSVTTDTVVVEFKNCDGVKEKESKLSFNIYPNPANIQITIELPQTAKQSTIKIYNISGEELIKQQAPKNKTEIDVRNLPSGIYFVKVVNESGVEIGKFCKLK